MQLYEKTTRGKTVRYIPYVEPKQEETVLTFTDAQAVTAAGSLGTILLIVFERNIPPHKLIARKIKAVEEAILELYRGTGQAIDDEIAELMCKTWDETMRRISGT